MKTVSQKYFPDGFSCYYEDETTSPLVVSPAPNSTINLIEWAKGNQKEIAAAIKEFGAIVFNGFNITKENFPITFSAVIGQSLRKYPGNSLRKEVSEFAYESTVVAPKRKIPLHQEVSYRPLDMPEYISFFCNIPPKEGTGQTIVGNVKNITKKISELMPEFWEKLSTKKNLTYVSRILPEKCLYTSWVRYLNPSQATYKTREELEEQCRQQPGVTLDWDGDCGVVSRKGSPAFIERDGEKLFCNQIPVNVFNWRLCGKGIIGRIMYIIARILLFPTSRWNQYDVRFDDGTKISPDEAAKILDIMEEEEQARSWKEQGDMMVVGNVETMHGKRPHEGAREILFAMSGYALES